MQGALMQDPGAPPEVMAKKAGGEQAGAMGEQDRELFDLLVARTLEAVQNSADDFDVALKADPVKAAVEFGTSALHAVTLGADDAGQQISFPVLVQAGMQVIKEIGAIANDKGYLPDEGIETYLKEAFQQSLQKFVKLDGDAGKIKPEELQAVQQKLGGGRVSPPPGQGAARPAPGGPPGGDDALPGALAAGGM